MDATRELLALLASTRVNICAPLVLRKNEVVGAGLAAYSFSPVSAAQTTYDQDPSPDTSDALYNAVGQANTVLATGVVGVVLGTGLWMWAP